MGVRFECPRGHLLNVKSELAGKRAICPLCGVKFYVPTESGGRVPEADAAGESSIRQSASPAAKPGAGADGSWPDLPTRGVAPASRPIAGGDGGAASQQPAEPAMWYVRPSHGGQFGPASEEVFRQWVAEDRVAPDSWVWRTGWLDWKPGADAIALAMGPAEQTAAAAPVLPAGAGSPLGEGAADVTLGQELAPTVGASTATAAAAAPMAVSGEAYRLARLRRQKLNQRLTIVLGVVALLLVAVLVVVLANRRSAELVAPPTDVAPQGEAAEESGGDEAPPPFGDETEAADGAAGMEAAAAAD